MREQRQKRATLIYSSTSGCIPSSRVVRVRARMRVLYSFKFCTSKSTHALVCQFDLVCSTAVPVGIILVCHALVFLGFAP